jgi:hypothetical protein
MSAIVEAVGDVFEAVGDAVGSVVEGIGNVVEKVMDEVVEPVVKAVGNTVEAAMNDPVGTLIKVGTAVFAPALLPAVNFGMAVVNGVPIEKALGNVALSYVGGQIGTQVGNYATNAFDLGCTASTIFTEGAKGAAGAGLRGDSMLEGAVGSMANSALNLGANAAVKGLSDAARTSHLEEGYFAPGGAGYYDKDLYDSIAPTTDSLGPSPSNDQILRDIGYYGDDQTSGLEMTSGSLGESPSNEQILQDIGYYDTQSGGLPSGAENDMGEIEIVADRPKSDDLSEIEIFGNRPRADDLGEIEIVGERPPPVDDLGEVEIVGERPKADDLGEIEIVGERPAPEDVLGETTDTSGFKLPQIKLPQINLPKAKTVQAVGGLGGLGCSAIPWLDTRDSLLRNQIVFDNPEQTKIEQEKLSNIYGRMDSCLAKEMQERFGGVPQIKLKPFDEPMGGLEQGTGFAVGGNVKGSATYCYNQDAKYMPKFIDCGPDSLVGSAASKRVPLSHKQLMHLQPRISNMGNMGGLASGGLPKKYQEAMPKDHKPEFVTGMTGYYACGGGTGQSDDIPAMLHDGDYVMDADVVAALGDGSSKAGREVLEGFRSQIRHDETAKGKPVPAKIADGEYVFPAGFVSALGGGDNKAGAKILDGLREKLRAHKRSAPTSKIPPKAKSPLDYIKQAKG